MMMIELKYDNNMENITLQVNSCSRNNSKFVVIHIFFLLILWITFFVASIFSVNSSKIIYDQKQKI